MAVFGVEWRTEHLQGSAEQDATDTDVLRYAGLDMLPFASVVFTKEPLFHPMTGVSSHRQNRNPDLVPALCELRAAYVP